MILAPSLPIFTSRFQSLSGGIGAAAAVLPASIGLALMGAHPSSETFGLLITKSANVGANVFLAEGAVYELGSEGTSWLYGRGVHTPHKLQKTPLAAVTVVFAVAAAAATAPALRQRRENLLCALLSAVRPSVGSISGRP